MRRTTITIARSLRTIQSNPYLLHQTRTFCAEVSQSKASIGHVYNALLTQAADQAVECNFATQVIDPWAKDPSRLAIRCADLDGDNHADITYQELVERSHQVAQFFLESGFKQGDAVALMLGQRPAWWYSLAGLIRAGIAAVPCPRLLTPNDLLYRFNDLGIRGIITAPELESQMDAIRDRCPTLSTTITTGQASDRWVSMEDILNNNKHSIDPTPTTTETPCLYLYTSGTTGQPKAVQHNADYPFFHWPTGRRWLQATPSDVVYNASDTGWGFTVWTTTAAWTMGAKILITPTDKKFSPKKMLETLRDEGVTIFCAAPTVLRLLAAEPDFDRISFPRLKRIATVGEALDETVIKRFEMRGIQVAVGFGQAETPLIMGRVDDQLHTPGTMGAAIDPYKVTILDEKYCPVPPGNIGQIAVDLKEGASGGIMRRYANSPERTQQSRSPDGRYHLTGDWALYRPDGLFSYEGRRDDLIKSRGYRIGPNEVEKAGMSHPAVAKIAVVGVRTNADSHAVSVKAFILLKPGYTALPELIKDIQAHIKHETGPYKYPRLVECLGIEEWEKYETTSGKIRRAGLRQREEEKLLANNEAGSSPPSYSPR